MLVISALRVRDLPSRLRERLTAEVREPVLHQPLSCRRFSPLLRLSWGRDCGVQISAGISELGQVPRILFYFPNAPLFIPMDKPEIAVNQQP